MQRLAFLLISIILSLALLYFVLRDVPLAAIAAALQSANIFWSILSLFTVFLAILTRAIRWRGLLGQRLSYKDSFLIMSITFLLNQLPFRLGEIARSLLVTRRQIPLVTAATSIVLERLLDILVVVLLIAWSLSQIPTIDPQISFGAMLFGGMGLIGFLALLFLAHFPQIVHKIPLIERFVPHFLDALAPLTAWKSLSHTLIWTILAWTASYLSLYTSTRALDLPTTPSFIALALGLSTLSIAIPTTLAGIGFIEGAIQLSGSIFAFEAIRTTALGFLFHGLSVLAYLIFGIPSTWLLGISLGDLLQTKAETLSQK